MNADTAKSLIGKQVVVAGFHATFKPGPVPPPPGALNVHVDLNGGFVEPTIIEKLAEDN